MDKTFPLLFAKASTGKIKVWQIRVESVGKAAKIITYHGYIDSEELRSAEVKVAKGKNIGKKNETTPFEQACSQAESKWNKKKDKKYVEDPSGDSDILLPMLAQTFTKRKHDIDWPALGQPKLNGVRCLARREGKVIHYTSREAKPFTTLEHITPTLLKLMKDDEIFDGEVFTTHLTFQEIISAVKRQQENTLKLQLWVYDVISDDPFWKRDRFLKGRNDFLKGLPGSSAKDTVKFLLATELLNEKKMMEWHKFWAHPVPMKHVDGRVLGETPATYEGTIVRNRQGFYKQDFRSKDLQKYKDFIDEEYEIIGYHDGEGKDEGAVTWICVTKAGEEFDCTPNGTYEQRRQWWRDRKKYIGKMLTVRYQNLSDDRKVPIFPKGIIIRDYE
jgi:DNA ligase-1